MSNGYPGDPWVTEVQTNHINPRYVAAGREVPLDPESAVWIGRTLWDIGNGMSKEASLQKHMTELDAALGLQPTPSPSPFGPEFGSLNRNGKFLFREDGSVFDWRGCSMFLIPNRAFRGELFAEQIDWMKRHGFNVARMFVAGVDWSDWPEKIFEYPNYQQVLSGIFNEFEDNGIRIEASIVTYGISTGTWNEVIRKVYSVINRFHVAETMNEPWAHSKGDPVAMMQGINTNSVLSNYGIAPHEDSGYYFPFNNNMPRLDIITPHLRRDDAHMSRGAKDAWEMREHFNMPTCSDEPIGAGEVEEPGRRTTNKKKLCEHHAIARLLYGCSTYHFQAGLEGRAPNANEPTQENIANGLTEVFKFIPANSQTGQYTRPGLAGWPVEWYEGMADHPYASILGNECYLVMTECSDSWVPEPIDGWRVETIHPEFNWLVKLVR